MMYVIMALDLLGYPPDHPDRVEAQKQFDALMVDDGKRFFFQPCLFRGLGCGDRGLRIGRIARAARGRAAQVRGLAADQRSAAQRRLVGEAAEHASPPAGISNSPTSFIRISTTPPWCCWP